MRRTLIIAAAAVAALAAHPAHAQNGQNGHRAVVSAQLDSATAFKGREGFAVERAADGQTVVGMLPNRGSVVLEVNLRAGVQYWIAAGCDSDCDDLDLRLHSPQGQAVLDEDVEADDVPILSFTSEVAGPHLLTVMMSTCKTELCYFGYRVLAKR